VPVIVRVPVFENVTEPRASVLLEATALDALAIVTEPEPATVVLPLKFTG